MQQISTTVRLEGVTPAARTWPDSEVAILRLGDADILFPRDPEARAAIALEMIECLNEIRTEALKRALMRGREAELGRADARLERMTEGVAS